MLPLLVCAAVLFASVGGYAIPDPEFEVLKPSGLTVSIPNEDGIQAFYFHGNVNRELIGLEGGQISQEASIVENGKFTIYDENVNLQNGDVINYCIYVVYNGLTYQLDNGKFVYQGSNIKNRGGCPPGYKKKVKVSDHDAHRNDEITTWSSSDHDETTGSDGLYNYHRFYQHGFPNNHYGGPGYPFYRRGYVNYHFNGPQPERGRGHNHWHRRYHNYNYNQFGDTDIPHASSIVKRQADSEEDKDQSGDVELESRFGGFSGGFGGANFIYPRRPHKSHRPHGYRFRGHGYGYGYHHGNRPHGHPHHPYPGGPYPSYPEFGKDHNKFDDYYDCEEDDSNEDEKPSEPMNLDTTTSTTQTSESNPEEPPSTSSTSTTTTTTTTTTQRTSTFPQIDIRFGNR